MSSNQRILIFVLLGTVLVSQVQAWHSLGHMTVAAIAQFYMQKSELGNKAYQWATDLITPFSYYCGELDHPFVDSASWPDKIQVSGWKTMFNWHFTDTKLAAEGFIIPDSNTTDEDVVWSIEQAVDFLSSVKKDFSGKSKEILGKSLEMRNLIHFIGDFHQPLHAVSRFSDEHPNGDLGGNLFKIQHYDDPKWNNLHFIWDHIFDLPDNKGGDLWSPIRTPEEWKFVSDFANSIMDEHSYQSLSSQMLKNPTAKDWAAESFELCKSFVYNLKEDEKIPDEYYQQGRVIVKKQMALAGYRLADTILGIYQKWVAQKSQKMQELVIE